jgi:hypothetical protein
LIPDLVGREIGRYVYKTASDNRGIQIYYIFLPDSLDLMAMVTIYVMRERWLYFTKTSLAWELRGKDWDHWLNAGLESDYG